MMFGSRAALALMISATCVVAAHAQQIMYVQPYPAQPTDPYSVQPQPVYPAPQYAPRGYPYVMTPQQPAAPVVHYRKKPRRNPAYAEDAKGERSTAHHKRSKVQGAVRAEKGGEPAELRSGDKKKYSKTIVVREKPIVRNHYRVVDDPPVVVRREINEDGTVASVTPVAPLASEARGARVIHAEAEVTILGPDRMNIRLYRRNGGLEANAKAITKKNKY